MSKYRHEINYYEAGELKDDEEVVSKEDITNVIDDIEAEVILIREKLEVITGIDLIDDILRDLNALEGKLY